MNDEDLIAMMKTETGARGGAMPPASLDAVIALEAAVGFPMPPLLRRIYLEVADGGFGLDGQALSLTDDDYQFSDGDRLIEEYAVWLDMDHGHPQAVVPLLSPGDALWWFVDFSTTEGRTWGWDPNVFCPRHALYPEPFVLADRLADWLGAGELDAGELDAWRPEKDPACPECQAVGGS